MLNKKEIDELLKQTKENAEYAKQLSDSIVQEYTRSIDQIMREVKKEIIESPSEPPTETLEKYFLLLSNSLYFISAKAESLGLFEDITKSNLKMKYNSAFSERQLSASLNKEKITNNEAGIYAEDNSLNETVVNYIYSRANKIVEAKINAAFEMVKTISKIISRRMNENSSISQRQFERVSNNESMFTFGE